jgi:uncharacterized repeat protein (TIGR01451 family)
MKLVINFLLGVLISLSALVIVKATVLAETGGYFYGGGVPSAEIMVDKLVKEPSKGIFVDNLGPTDYKYGPEQEINFKVIVKNTGNRELNDIQLRDVFPFYLDFVNGPNNHVWQAASHEMTVPLGVLKPGESIEFITTGKVKPKADLPADKSLVCLTNWVEVKSENVIDADSAGLCIQNLSFLPATGPSLLPIILTIGLGVSGIVLVKKFNFIG